MLFSVYLEYPPGISAGSESPLRRSIFSLVLPPSFSRLPLISPAASFWLSAVLIPSSPFDRGSNPLPRRELRSGLAVF